MEINRDSVVSPSRHDKASTENRFVCCCQCHINQRLPPANKPRARPPFSRNGSDDKKPIRSKLKFRTSSSWRPYKDCKFRDSFRTRTEYRDRKKNHSWISVDHTYRTKCLCKSLKLFKKRLQRMRIMFQCVIFVIILSFCGVLMYSDSHSNKDLTIDYYPNLDHDKDYYSSGLSNNVILDIPFKSASIDEFEKQLDESESVADLLRIFFEQKDLSDFEINTILNMKSNKYVYGTHFKRENTPRIWMNDDEDAVSDRAAAFEHMKEMARSPLGTCRHPHPEIECVSSVEADTFRHYYPRCTVVHRCRNYTGCCPHGEVCGPKKDNGIRIFTKAFLVFETVPGKSGRLLPSGEEFVQTRSFMNHTECECHRVHVSSNCHKRCPQQFTKRRHRVDCECECTAHARLCKLIQRGLRALEEKDLECIKAGECIKPNCAYGEFRIHTGFCPTKARNYHRRKL